MEEITEATDLTEADWRSRWTGVFIGILAVLLAICSMGGDNAAKDANRANIDATNNWAFFQSKNLRRQMINLRVDQMQIELVGSNSLAPEIRAATQTKLKDYQELAKRLTSEPEKQEGLDELYAMGKSLEAERDAALARDPYFDWAQALLQIAIVLASVSIVARSWWLLTSAGALGISGALLTLNGFTMWWALPWLTG